MYSSIPKDGLIIHRDDYPYDEDDRGNVVVNISHQIKFRSLFPTESNKEFVGKLTPHELLDDIDNFPVEWDGNPEAELEDIIPEMRASVIVYMNKKNPVMSAGALMGSMAAAGDSSADSSRALTSFGQPDPVVPGRTPWSLSQRFDAEQGAWVWHGHGGPVTHL